MGNGNIVLAWKMRDARILTCLHKNCPEIKIFFENTGLDVEYWIRLLRILD
jgi:hypothetical protein